MSDPIQALCNILLDIVQTSPSSKLNVVVEKVKSELDQNGELTNALQTDSRMLQINLGQTKGYQVLVEANATAYIGDRYYFDTQAVIQALGQLLDEIALRQNSIRWDVQFGADNKLIDKINILFLAVNPNNSNLSLLDREVKGITDRIIESNSEENFEIATCSEIYSNEFLKIIKEKKPQVLHLTRYLNSKHKKIRMGLRIPDMEILYELLKNNRIRVVFLNIHHSTLQAQQIAELVDCVIEIKSPMYDKIAIKFAASFYHHLSLRKSVKNSFEQALVSIALSDLDTYNIPSK